MGESDRSDAAVGSDRSRPSEGPSSRTVPRIEALTGLRFVAAAIVLVEHFPQIVPGVSEHRLAQGGAGVSMFFVLSGFVLVLNYGDVLANRPDRAHLWRYAVARFARIVPLHLAALAVVAVIVLWRREQVETHGVVAILLSLAVNALLLQAWIPAQVFDIWNGPAWSISAEIFFYVCLPLLVPLLIWPLMRRRWVGRAIVVVIVVQLAAFVAVSFVAGQILLERGGGVEAARLVVGRIATIPLLRLGEFVVGCLLAAAFRPSYRSAARGGWRLLEQHRTRRMLLVGAVLVAGVIQLLPSCLGGACGPDATTSLEFVDFKIFAVYVPIVTVIVAVVAWGHGSKQSVLRHPVMVRLGEASYALYIIQWIAWLVINDRAVGPPTAVHAVLAIAGTIAAALVVHQLIEKPARRWVLSRFGGATNSEAGRAGERSQGA